MAVEEEAAPITAAQASGELEATLRRFSTAPEADSHAPMSDPALESSSATIPASRAAAVTVANAKGAPTSMFSTLEKAEAAGIMTALCEGGATPIALRTWARKATVALASDSSSMEISAASFEVAAMRLSVERMQVGSVDSDTCSGAPHPSDGDDAAAMVVLRDE